MRHVSNTDGSNENFLAGFMDDYFAECDEHLTMIRRTLLASEAGEGLSAAALEELFRGVHSLKGLSGMVELREAELIAHHMESYLRDLRGKTASLSAHGLGALIEGAHALEQTIAARKAGQPFPEIDPIVARLSALAGAPAAAPPAADSAARRVDPPAPAPARGPRWLAVFIPSAELAARGIGVDRVRALLRAAGEIIHAAPRVAADGGISFEFVLEGVASDADIVAWAEQGIVVTPAVETPLHGAAQPGVPAGVSGANPAALLAPSHYVRVDLARLDDLMRMIGDVVISRARLADSLVRVEPRVAPALWRAVQENNLAIERQLRDLREGVMRVRLVPVGEIFRRMPFVVRDLAREMDKKVELEMLGQDTEIDKFLIERMLDPILHLVRNAVSHGIESAAERVAAGKPETGKITLSAASVGDRVVLEVTDDGRGVDGARVAARARDVGLALPDGPLDADALLDILCAPGFSTRDSADRISGRGVGMSVVQTSVQELGGTMSIDLGPGQGARFVIELPLTLAITDAIISRVGAQTFAIPQAAIREVVEIDPRTVRALENNEIAPHRGGVLPIIRLAAVFGLEPRAGRALHVFVIGHGQAAVGLAVDRIVGQREVVVRTLTDALIKVDGIVGATDLGDGKVVLILDAARLAAHARERSLIPHGAQTAPLPVRSPA
jgi:two-component system chemotaxis sensor kinase CheA